MTAIRAAIKVAPEEATGNTRLARRRLIHEHRLHRPLSRISVASGKKCYRNAPVHAVALRFTLMARIEDGNCVKNRNMRRNPRLTATVLRDKV